jgi:hypothetical protein
MYIIIIIGMNVVDNLNPVYVINKPCMSSRGMSLLPRATLHSDSELSLPGLNLRYRNAVTRTCDWLFWFSFIYIFIDYDIFPFCNFKIGA